MGTSGLALEWQRQKPFVYVRCAHFNGSSLAQAMFREFDRGSPNARLTRSNRVRRATLYGSVPDCHPSLRKGDQALLQFLASGKFSGVTKVSPAFPAFFFKLGKRQMNQFEHVADAEACLKSQGL